MDIIDPHLSVLNPKQQNEIEAGKQHESMNETPFAGERKAKLTKKGTKRSKAHDSGASPLRQIADTSGVSDHSGGAGEIRGGKAAKKGRRLGIRPAKKKSKFRKSIKLDPEEEKTDAKALEEADHEEEEKAPAKDMAEALLDEQGVSNDLP